MVQRKQKTVDGTAPSRSALKRRAEAVEDLARELVESGPATLRHLPLDEELSHEIRSATDLRGGSRKRQIKHLAKMLRERETDPLLQALDEQRGSHLRQKNKFLEMERIRNLLVDEASFAYDTALRHGEELVLSWSSPTLDGLARDVLSSEDVAAIRSALYSFVRTRKKRYFREVFRILQAAAQRRERDNRLRQIT